MMTILTHQSASSQGRDVLVINGEKSDYSGAQNQLEAQKLIREVSKPMYNKWLPRIFQGAKISPSLKVFITDSNTLVISSNFQSKDDKGRNISYDYYCDSIEDPSKVVRILADDSRIAGMTPNPADLQALNKYLNFYKHRARNYTLLGVAIIVVLFVLFKLIF